MPSSFPPSLLSPSPSYLLALTLPHSLPLPPPPLPSSFPSLPPPLKLKSRTSFDKSVLYMISTQIKMCVLSSYSPSPNSSYSPLLPLSSPTPSPLLLPQSSSYSYPLPPSFNPLHVSNMTRASLTAFKRPGYVVIKFLILMHEQNIAGKTVKIISFHGYL